MELQTGPQAAENNSPPMNNTLMRLLPIRVEKALRLQGNAAGEGELWKQDEEMKVDCVKEELRHV